MYQHNVIENTGRVTAGTTHREYDGKDFNLSLGAGDTSQSLSHRKALFYSLSLPLENGIFARQVHGDKVLEISLSEKGLEGDGPTLPECDGLMTSRPEVVLCIQTADCYPIFMYDPVHQAIALIHAGWRGTARKITYKTIHLLSEAYQSNPEDLIVSIGPGIHSCCYEVSHQFMDDFSPQVLKKRKDQYYLDLLKENVLQAQAAAVPEDNILIESSLCTVCHLDRFYSHRKEGSLSGRMVSFLSLKQE
ncbi:MAG: laccase domain protein [bacterium]|nr:MAG: laccase domain protein [bacterium]